MEVQISPYLKVRLLDATCLSWGFLVQRYHEHASSSKGKLLVGVGLQFQSFSQLSLWQEARRLQADMVLETLRVVPFYMKAAAELAGARA